eukprot:COSAG05_NODE_1865_length_3934_cov_6.136375_1_plen_97_part_10
MHYARLNHSPVARSAPLVGAARGSAQRPKPCTVLDLVDLQPSVRNSGVLDVLVYMSSPRQPRAGCMAAALRPPAGRPRIAPAGLRLAPRDRPAGAC